MSFLPLKPSFFSTSSSTGRPWVSHPALRVTRRPCATRKRQIRSLMVRAKTWWMPGRPLAVGGPSKKTKGSPAAVACWTCWKSFSVRHSARMPSSRAVGDAGQAGNRPTWSDLALENELRLRVGAFHLELGPGLCARLQAFDLAELALEEGAEIREVGGELALRRLEAVAHHPFLVLGAGHDAERFRLGLTQHRLCLPFRLLLHVGAELLRRHEGLIHRLLALAEGAELLLHPAHPLLELRPLAQEPIERLGDAVAELLDLRDVIAAERACEFLPAYVVRRQIEGIIGHWSLVPKRRVPSRTSVAPSSIATP